MNLGCMACRVIDHNAATGRKDAVVYCNRATIPQVRVDTGTQVLGVDYFLWVATLDGTLVTPGPEHLDGPPYTYPGVIGCQGEAEAAVAGILENLAVLTRAAGQLG